MSLEREVRRYSKVNGYEISKFKPVVCGCGNDQLELSSDDENGAAFVYCPECDTEADVESSRQYAEKVFRNVCNCDTETMSIGVGIATYDKSDDPRWIYVGAHCPKCGLDGVYTDWQER